MSIPELSAANCETCWSYYQNFWELLRSFFFQFVVSSQFIVTFLLISFKIVFSARACNHWKRCTKLASCMCVCMAVKLMQNIWPLMITLSYDRPYSPWQCLSTDGTCMVTIMLVHDEHVKPFSLVKKKYIAIFCITLILDIVKLIFQNYRSMNLMGGVKLSYWIKMSF